MQTARRLGFLSTAVAVLLFGQALAGKAAADEHAAEAAVARWVHEVKVGILHHDTPDLWSGFRRESGIDINLEAIFAPKLDILGGAIRPALGGSVNTAGDTSKLYVGIRWQYELTIGFFVGLGLGGAVHDGNLDLTNRDRKALGSRVLFHIPVEIGYRFKDSPHALSVYFDHISNAYTADENEGMDTLGLRYGYRFRTGK